MVEEGEVEEGRKGGGGGGGGGKERGRREGMEAGEKGRGLQEGMKKRWKEGIGEMEKERNV